MVSEAKGEEFSRQPVPYGKAEVEVTRVKGRSEAKGARMTWKMGWTVGRDN